MEIHIHILLIYNHIFIIIVIYILLMIYQFFVTVWARELLCLHANYILHNI